MTCVCECHTHKGQSLNQTSATPLQGAPPTTTTSHPTLHQPNTTIGSSHLAPPTPIQLQPIPTVPLIFNQASFTLPSLNLQTAALPPLVLPAMMLPALSSSILLDDAHSEVTAVKSVAESANLAPKTQETATSSMACASTSKESNNHEAEKSVKSKDTICSEAQKSISGKPGTELQDREVSGTHTIVQPSETSKVCEGESVTAEPSATSVNLETKSVEKSDGMEKVKEEEVTVVDDDFKPPKKRFRTPAATASDGPVS